MFKIRKWGFYVLIIMICNSSVYGVRDNILKSPPFLIMGEYQVNKEKIIIPYLVNLMAIDHLINKKEEAAEKVKKYINWYFEHLNYPDKFSITGTVYDYTIYPDGREVSLRSSKSIPSNSATFLILLHRYLLTTRDTTIIEKNRKKIGDIAYTIPFLQDSNGLIRSTPDNNKFLLRDSCLSYIGTGVLNKVYQLMGWEINNYYKEVNKKILSGIQTHFSNKSKDDFYWCLDPGRTPPKQIWKSLHDTYRKLFPVILKKTDISVKKNRLHFDYIYEDVNVDGEHGIWESYYIMYYRYQKSTFNFFVHGGMIKRYGKNDFIGLLGFAKDWATNFYTYSVVAKGTVSTYLPNARIDHDFNFKLGSKRNTLFTIGATYIKYYVPAEDFIISSGLTLFRGNWVYGYRLFNNHKYPGNITSFTHLANIEYGIDKSHWTTFSVSWGSQAYLALYVLTPEEIRQSALNVNLKHRQWLSRNVCLYGWAGFVKIKGYYDKLLLSAGIFFDF